MIGTMNAGQQQHIFEDWLADHRGLFFKIVRAYAFTHHDQEDLFQVIATQVWNSVPNYRGESKTSTWIYRVALFAAISWSKKERKYRDHHRDVDASTPTLLAASPRQNPRVEWLYEQISQLDEIDRSLTLMMLDGFSYADIATTLGISESHVGVKLNRLKKHLSNLSKEGTDDEI